MSGGMKMPQGQTKKSMNSGLNKRDSMIDQLNGEVSPVNFYEFPQPSQVKEREAANSNLVGIVQQISFDNNG